MKDQEGHKIYWASGNRVLDTFSMIQCMQSVAYAMLTYLCPLQSGWSSQIREWVRPSDKNVAQDTRPSLYTYVKFWA